MILTFPKVLLIMGAAVLLLVVLAALMPLQTINALTPTTTYDKTPDLAYGADPRQRLDIYTPHDSKEPAPVVVFFYGGNWNSGTRGDYQFVGEALAARGIVAVIADYRLYPQVRYPDFAQDSAQVVAWSVRQISHYGGDPKRLYVMGHSAGAYNAAMVALDGHLLGKYGMTPAILRGWIGLAGPYDFIPIENRETRPVFLYPDTPPESQPINHVTANAPPTLLIASNRDNLVDPQRNTGGLAKRLRAAGDKVSEIYFDGTSHTTLVGSIAWPLRGLAPTLDTIVHFVQSDGERVNAPIVPVR